MGALSGARIGGRLTYSMSVSVDGFIADREGAFDSRATPGSPRRHWPRRSARRSTRLTGTWRSAAPAWPRNLIRDQGVRLARDLRALPALTQKTRRCGPFSGRYWARRRGREAALAVRRDYAACEVTSVPPTTLRLVPGLVPGPNAASMIAASLAAASGCCAVSRTAGA